MDNSNNSNPVQMKLQEVIDLIQEFGSQSKQINDDRRSLDAAKVALSRVQEWCSSTQRELETSNRKSQDILAEIKEFVSGEVYDETFKKIKSVAAETETFMTDYISDSKKALSDCVRENKTLLDEFSDEAKETLGDIQGFIAGDVFRQSILKMQEMLEATHKLQMQCLKEQTEIRKELEATRDVMNGLKLSECIEQLKTVASEMLKYQKLQFNLSPEEKRNIALEAIDERLAKLDRILSDPKFKV